ARAQAARGRAARGPGPGPARGRRAAAARAARTRDAPRGARPGRRRAAAPAARGRTRRRRRARRRDRSGRGRGPLTRDDAIDDVRHAAWLAAWQAGSGRRGGRARLSRPGGRHPMTQPQYPGAEVPGGGGELDWLLDSLVQRVAPVQNAVVLSGDGLRIAASSGLAREESDHLSAVAASFQSLARGAGETFGGGPVRQTI